MEHIFSTSQLFSPRTHFLWPPANTPLVQLNSWYAASMHRHAFDSGILKLQRVMILRLSDRLLWLERDLGETPTLSICMIPLFSIIPLHLHHTIPLVSDSHQCPVILVLQFDIRWPLIQRTKFPSPVLLTGKCPLVPGLQESKLKKPPLCPRKLELKTRPVCPIPCGHGSCPARILEGAWITVRTGFVGMCGSWSFFCARWAQVPVLGESRMRARAWTWSRIGSKGKSHDVLYKCNFTFILSRYFGGWFAWIPEIGDRVDGVLDADLGNRSWARVGFVL